MRFRKYILAILCFSGVSYSTNSLAQQIDTIFSDINYIRKSNAILNSKNASGLKYFSLPKASSAQLFFNKADGDFKNYHQSDNSYDYGLQTESFFRLNPKVVFYGDILYRNFKGNNMAGSGFIDPYKTPFDIVEANDNNRGVKQQEIYKLTGKVSVELSSKFTVGGGLEYEASNFAKMRDLRHVNKLLDIDASLGGLYQLNKSIEIGLNYNYLRRIESISFESHGNVDKGFVSLISFGAFYGRAETFSKEGYTSSENTWPLADIGHAGTMQLNLYLNKHIHFLNEFTFTIKNGFFGRKSSASKPFTEHTKNSIVYNGTLSLNKGKNEHHFSLRAGYETLVNNENTDLTGTPIGGASQILIVVTKEVLDRQELKASLNYALFKNVRNNTPEYTFDANIDYFRRQQTMNYLYPFYRDQTINSYQIKANIKRNMVKTNHMYSFGVGLGYGSGSGLAKYDGLHAAPSSNKVPTSMDLYLYQEFEYFTKPRVMADISLQYTKKMKQNIAPYAKLSYNYTKAFDTQFLGSSFGVAGASVGCNF